ncbi:hypothetical protein tb265_16870 [Gemmatimonadetes bacterium T265]|nr:hypothetical protein tb265_16870 [Gemmatimonadetes bacterium T265]
MPLAAAGVVVVVMGALRGNHYAAAAPRARVTMPPDTLRAVVCGAGGPICHALPPPVGHGAAARDDAPVAGRRSRGPLRPRAAVELLDGRGARRPLALQPGRDALRVA